MGVAVLICAFIILTLLTQIGGIALLIGMGIVLLPRLHSRHRAGRWLAGLAVSVVVYAGLTGLVVPPLARSLGREPLPCWAAGDGHLVPATWLTCAMNRGYVRPDLRELLHDLGAESSRRFPGSRITTLEGNFPFVDGFPLLPHLSHIDGKKVDLAFFYEDASESDRLAEGSPSPIGYFVYEQPRPGDVTPCAGRWTPLRWDFDLFQPQPPRWRIDTERTAWMIEWLKARPEVSRILLEPHLAERLGVTGGKVRFQGCHAARHDDHIHLQIR